MTRITFTDIEDLLRLCAFAPIAWTAPERSWPAISEAAAGFAGAVLPGKRRRLGAQMPPFLLDLANMTPSQAAGRFIARCYQDDLAKLRAYRPGGWHPEISMLGRERLDQALSSGHGAILWVADFQAASLVAKMAFARHGYRVSHLSRPIHGFSTTDFGIRFLNRIQTRIEDRYLADRIVLTDESVRSLRELHRRLNSGAIVSITVGDNAAKTVTVPLFEGRLRLATGPVTLARSMGASLLPVFTRTREPGRFEVFVEPPLDTTSPRDDETPFHQYAELLAAHITRDPLVWKGWQSGWIGPQQTPSAATRTKKQV